MSKILTYVAWVLFALNVPFWMELFGKDNPLTNLSHKYFLPIWFLLVVMIMLTRAIERSRSRSDALGQPPQTQLTIGQGIVRPSPEEEQLENLLHPKKTAPASRDFIVLVVIIFVGFFVVSWMNSPETRSGSSFETIKQGVKETIPAQESQPTGENSSAGDFRYSPGSAPRIPEVGYDAELFGWSDYASHERPVNFLNAEAELTSAPRRIDAGVYDVDLELRFSDGSSRKITITNDTNRMQPAPRISYALHGERPVDPGDGEDMKELTAALKKKDTVITGNIGAEERRIVVWTAADYREYTSVDRIKAIIPKLRVVSSAKSF